MPFYVGDYLKDTLHLTTEEHGAYLLLLFSMWNNDCKLPFDEKKLARIARVSPPKWKVIREDILEFFQVEGEFITHSKMVEVAKKYKKKREILAKNGAKGGRAKSLKNNETTLANANQLLKQPEPEPEFIDKSINNKSDDYIFSQENLDAEKAKQEAKEKAQAEEKIKAANFEQLWKTYPSSRREAKAKTRKYYDAALKSYSHEQLFAALAAQLKTWEEDKIEDKYKKYLHRWLNDDAYVKFITDNQDATPSFKGSIDALKKTLGHMKDDPNYRWEKRHTDHYGIDFETAKQLVANK